MDRTAALRQLPYFAALSEAEVDHICRRSSDREVEPGELLVEQGSPSDALYIILEGEFEVVRRDGDREVPIGHAAAGDVLGEISLLSGEPRSATARARTPARVIVVGASEFEELMGHPEAARSVLRTVVGRLREIESAVQDHQRLAALGTLAAGIIHELNNPAAAVHRGAARLQELLGELWAVRSEAESVIPPEPPADRPAPDRFERSERTDALGSWLRAAGLDEPWELADLLAGAGWDVAALERAGIDPADERGRTALRLVVLRAEIADLVDEVRIGAERLSELVGAVKRYSHVGEAPIGEVDVHASLRDTLVVLRHQLRDVDVVEDLADGPLVVEGYGSELNQVWTNLIDNAVGAMDGDGRLVLRTRDEGNSIEVEVADDGTGIPDDVVGRVFDPFFTTKQPGEGTGLGLHLVRRIVARHGGTITVDSSPEGTTFRVRLPRQVPGSGG